MISKGWVLLACLIGIVSCGVVIRKREAETIEQEEVRAKEWITKLNQELNVKKNIATIAAWSYASNITDYNMKIKNEIATETAKYYKVNSCFIN